MSDTDHVFPVRVQRTAARTVRAYARGQLFEIDSQASLRPADPSPSAVEYVLGALGGDLVCGFERAASAQGLTLHAIEVALNGRLDNILVHLGVVGEQGHPGLGSIQGTVYVNADGDQQVIEGAWRTTLAHSPLYHTLTRSSSVTINLRIIAS